MPVFNQDPKIKEGSEVLVLNSLEEMPEQVKDGTILVVPSAESEDSGGSESGGGSVQSDYDQNDSTQPDYIKNRPFYEESVPLGDTLTWDGTPSDTKVEIEGVVCHHISDSAPSESELLGGSIGMGDESLEITEVNTLDEHISLIEFFFIVDTDNYTFDGITFPKKGIYVVSDTELTYPVFLHIPDYNFTKSEIKKLDEKYLPEYLVLITLGEAITADKTIAEIVAAKNEGKKVAFKIYSEDLYFVSSTFSVANVEISSDTVAGFITIPFPLPTNETPYVLTIRGMCVSGVDEWRLMQPEVPKETHPIIDIAVKEDGTINTWIAYETEIDFDKCAITLKFMFTVDIVTYYCYVTDYYRPSGVPGTLSGYLYHPSDGRRMQFTVQIPTTTPLEGYVTGTVTDMT